MTPAELAAPVVDAVEELVASGVRRPVVGLDGRSGAGKSTMAAAVAEGLRSGGRSVVVVAGDDFYAGGSAATWDGRSAEEKAASVIDWRRQRAVLGNLRDRGAAEWRPFDWDSDDWDAEPPPLAAEPVRAVGAHVIVLEGAYSCRPELADLLDLRVLLDVPDERRRRQLLGREGDEYRADWEARWSAAEDHYFGAVVPASSFDLVVGHA